MTTTPHGQVPEALRLAEEISNLVCSSEAAAKTIAAAADELCRLHVENASLRAALAASPTPPAEQQAQPGAVYAELPAPTASIGIDDAWHEPAMRDFADRTHAARLRCKSEQARLATLWGYVRADAAPKAAPGVGNSGFDHQTAADFLSGKTVSDEAVRKFVQASRWAHDEKASLSAMLLSVRGELASREAEIALLKKALLEAEAAPQQEAQEPATVPYQKLTNEIDQILSDPDTELSIGAKRALLWVLTWVSVPLWTTPQPAPDCHHRPPCDECAALAAQGGKV